MRCPAPKFLNDALFNCYKARHDAVDAATAYVAINLDLAAEKIGFDVITQVFHKFTELRLKLNTIRGEIVKSRENREDRDAIYSSLEIVDFKEFVDLFKEYLSSEPVMVEMAKRARRNKFRNEVFGWFGIVIAIMGIVIAVVVAK